MADVARTFWTSADTQILTDTSLSWGARGLYAYLKSLRPGAAVTLDTLCVASTQGRAATRRLVQELVDAHVVEYRRAREGGRYTSRIAPLAPGDTPHHGGSVTGTTPAD